MSTQPALSVIIPTKDRSRTLAATLESLASQEVDEPIEVVVADNGSTDDTAAVLDAAGRSTLPLVTVKQPAGGPAAARNAAVAASHGRVLLLLGDDTEPASDDLLASHLRLHCERRDPRFAVLGRISWSSRHEVTDFMAWLDDGGPQFHYFEIAPGRVDPRNYFYSSHLSLSRTAFERVGGFDERFPYAAVEDTDIGTRLAGSGLVLEYHPELRVLHDHPTSIRTSLDRAVRVGRSAALYNRIAADRPHARVGAPSGTKIALGRLADPALSALSLAPLPRWARRPIWAAAHRCRFAKGYAMGPAEAS